MPEEKRTKNLKEELDNLEDKRRKQGQKYKQTSILLIVIMGLMNGAKSERGIGRFAENNKEELIEILNLNRPTVPSRTLIRYVMQKIEMEKLSEIFYNWAKKYVKITEKDWLSIDGKSLRGTLRNAQNPEQNFKSLVSVFASKKKQIIAVSGLETKKTNEIPVVQKLIKTLDLENVIFTIDALHCQKKTTKTIIESKNDYVIGVKGNQKKLLKQLKKNTRTKI